MAIDNYISMEVIETITSDFMSLTIGGGFIITTLFIFITFGIFKAFTFFKDL